MYFLLSKAQFLKAIPYITSEWVKIISTATTLIFKHLINWGQIRQWNIIHIFIYYFKISVIFTKCNINKIP